MALKNDGDQVAALITYVDLSVNERCHELAECGQFLSAPAAPMILHPFTQTDIARPQILIAQMRGHIDDFVGRQVRPGV